MAKKPTKPAPEPETPTAKPTKFAVGDRVKNKLNGQSYVIERLKSKSAICRDPDRDREFEMNFVVLEKRP